MGDPQPSFNMSLKPGVPSPAGQKLRSPCTRGASSIDFQTATTGVASKAMKNELDKLANTISDQATKKAFEAEMNSFFLLFNRYLTEKAKGTKLDWDRIRPPAPEQIVPYKSLPKSQ